MIPEILLTTTTNVNNYGAALQAYALQRKLSDFGIVTILNYDNRHVSSSMDYVRFKPSLHGTLGLAKDICRLKPRIAAIKKFKAFNKEYLNLSPLMSKATLSDGQLRDYDLYVSGSDQIWNPNCVNSKGEIDETYFFDFVSNNKKKVSFASSWGGFQPTSAQNRKIQKLLSGYSQISVRERDTQEFLADLLKRDVQHSLDPTLLLQPQEWQELLSETVMSRVPPKYILMYSVPKLPFVLQAVKHMSKVMGLPIVALDQDPFAPIKGCTHIKDAGPKEFLSLFMNAAFVVTDSFHGTCFSINFSIPFLATSQGAHSNRISSLLEITGLQHRLIEPKIDPSDIVVDMSFKSAIAKLRQAATRDFSYLAVGILGLEHGS